MGQPRAGGESSRALGADDGPLRGRVDVVGEVAPLRRGRRVERRPLPPAASAAAVSGARCDRRRRPDERLQGSVRPRSAGAHGSGDRGARGHSRSASFPSGHACDRVRRGNRRGGLLSSSQVAAPRVSRRWSACRESISESTTCWTCSQERPSESRSVSSSCGRLVVVLGSLGRSGTSPRAVGTSFAPTRRSPE